MSEEKIQKVLENFIAGLESNGVETNGMKIILSDSSFKKYEQERLAIPNRIVLTGSSSQQPSISEEPTIFSSGITVMSESQLGVKI